MKNKIFILFLLIITPLFAAEKISFISPEQKSLSAIKKEITALKKEYDSPEDLNNIAWVKHKLAGMVKIDQTIRSYIDPLQKPSKGLRKLWKKIDRENTKTLKRILDKYYWIKISTFGKEADNDAWLLTQHADIKFQKKILKRLEELYPIQETNPANFAYLYDRVTVNMYKPQKYGTQGTVNEKKQWQPYAIEDPFTLNDRRKQMGLNSYEDYVQMINQAYNLK